jgi:branched-chain amino acid transport system substrate-binding protein
MVMNKKLVGLCSTIALTSVLSMGALAEGIPVLHISAFSGPTSDVGQPYGMGVADVLKYTNQNGGINGNMLDFESVDYGYNAPQAVALYKKAMSRNQLVALQGWGTADTEALVGFVAKDKVFTMSASFSAHLTDPKGTSERTKSPAPYNFFYGPSYSDGCRGLVAFAADDWKKRGEAGTPKFVHMGMNHPYPNAPKESCAAYAEELGFEILNPIEYSLSPGDFKAQCLSLKDGGAQYAYLGNTGGSNISLIKACSTVGVKTQFLANVWGWDMNAFAATGEAGDGVVFVNSTASWNDAAATAGFTKLSAISKMTATDDDYRSVHYIRGVCAASNMVDAMKVAQMKGELTGTTLKDAMETFVNHVPAGLEGVCRPSTWTADDHRGMTEVLVYQTRWNGGKPSMSRVYEANLPRRADWLGW